MSGRRAHDFFSCFLLPTYQGGEHMTFFFFLHLPTYQGGEHMIFFFFFLHIKETSTRHFFPLFLSSYIKKVSVVLASQSSSFQTLRHTGKTSSSHSLRASYPGIPSHSCICQHEGRCAVLWLTKSRYRCSVGNVTVQHEGNESTVWDKQLTEVLR